MSPKISGEGAKRAKFCYSGTMPKESLPLVLDSRPIPGGEGSLKVITEKGCELVEKLAATCQPHAAIAKRLGMDPKTFRRCRQDQPEVQTALEFGLALLECKLSDILMKHAMGDGKGAVIAAIYLTKAKLGWSDRGGASPDQRPNITINLPDSLPMEIYLKAVKANWREIDEKSEKE